MKVTCSKELPYRLVLAVVLLAGLGITPFDEPAPRATIERPDTLKTGDSLGFLTFRRVSQT